MGVYPVGNSFCHPVRRASSCHVDEHNRTLAMAIHQIVFYCNHESTVWFLHHCSSQMDRAAPLFRWAACLAKWPTAHLRLGRWSWWESMALLEPPFARWGVLLWMKAITSQSSYQTERKWFDLPHYQFVQVESQLWSWQAFHIITQQHLPPRWRLSCTVVHWVASSHWTDQPPLELLLHL